MDGARRAQPASACLEAAIKACELDPATVPDDLRHSFASLLIHEKRLSIVEIAEQMGHALTMTSDTDDHVT